MSEPRSKISLQKDGDWGAEVSVVSGSEGVYYLTLDTRDCKKLELYIPAENLAPYKSPLKNVPPDQALTRRSSDIKLTTRAPSRQLGVMDDGSYFAKVTTPEFFITLKLPNTDALRSVAVITVVYDREIVEQLTVNISNQLTKPTINNFVTSRAVLATDAWFDLSWEIKNADSILLERNGEPVPLNKDATAIAQKLNITTEANYKLTATNARGATSQWLTVKGHNQTGVYWLEQFTGGKKLLNLFADEKTNMLYALVLDTPSPGDNENVFLWETTDGCNWDSTGISFSNVDSSVDGAIPAVVAESSSVVWKGTVYLIGGSRFDPNEQSNTVYSFDLSKKGKWAREANAPFEPRMGQAVLVVKAQPADAGEIWVLGGYGQTGTVDDIYIFNGQWKKADEKMPAKLCMHNVALDEGGINVMAGFSDSPGMPDRSLTQADRYDLSTNKWARLGWKEGKEPIIEGTKAIAFAFEKIDGMKFIFGFYTGITNMVKASQISSLGAMDIEGIGLDFIVNELTATVHAVYFKKAIWFCVANNEGTLNTQDISYFIYREKLTIVKE